MMMVMMVMITLSRIRYDTILPGTCVSLEMIAGNRYHFGNRSWYWQPHHEITRDRKKGMASREERRAS
jgi:hypothetical protein